MEELLSRKMKVIQYVSAKLVVSKYYSNYSILRYSSSGSILFRFWKGIPGIWDLSKIQRGIRETFTGYGIWLRTFKAGFAKIWSRNGIGKENDIRDSDDRSSGCGIPVRKERDCRIRAPLLERTVFTIVRYTSYISTLEYISYEYRRWNLRNFKNILRINPRLKFWKGCNFVCSKTVNTTQLCFQLIPSSERQNLPTRRKNLH